MRDRKSQTKDFLEKGPSPKVDGARIYFLGMYGVLLKQDMVRHYGDPKSFERDFNYLSSRSGYEGLSFFTKTLPLLAKAVDSALASGSLTTPSAFKQASGRRYPAFLQVLFGRIFDENGLLKDGPCTGAVKDLRQILYLCYKYEVDYEENVIKDFLQNFKDVDDALGWEVPNSLEVIDEYVLKVARTLLDDLFGEAAICSDTCHPGHGPGALATGEKNWEKMNFKRRYKNLHEKFPSYKFFYANAKDLSVNVDTYWALERREYGVSKVCLVPKDSRGPRMICMEPLEFQYFQQGLSKEIVKTVETHELTRGHVNFADQQVNRQLALEGSLSKEVVTLDMKEASDRVSLWLVRELFADTSVLPLLEATRTQATKLPTGEEVCLKKFAPMGSATCFPTEALVFWSLAVSCLHVYDEIPLGRATRAVYVYGDDIIIKGENHMSLLDCFPNFGLKFNEGKCCTEGNFRESCGMDAMLGESINILKVKKPVPVSPYDAEGYVSYIALSNALWKDAYYSTSLYVDEKLRKLYGEIPRTGSQSDIPGLVDPRASGFPRCSGKRTKFRIRWNKELQANQYQVKKLTTKKKHTMEMVSLSPAQRAEAVAEFGYSRDRSEYHRKVINKCNEEFVAGVYTVPHCIKLKTGWSANVV